VQAHQNPASTSSSASNRDKTCLCFVLFVSCPADLAAVIAATAELVAQVQAHQATALTQGSASN
jgi:hypothetical protein